MESENATFCVKTNTFLKKMKIKVIDLTISWNHPCAKFIVLKERRETYVSCYWLFLNIYKSVPKIIKKINSISSFKNDFVFVILLHWWLIGLVA